MSPSRVVLLTQRNSKREHYFCSALNALNVEGTVFYSFAQFWQARQPGDVVKIDPPDIHAYGVENIPDFTKQYLQDLEQLGTDPTLTFLNTPAAIATALDKRQTKQALLAAAVPTPRAVGHHIGCFEELIETMQAARCFRVFVKPRFGAGAAGVCAFAWNLAQGRGVLYSSLAQKDGKWINTKQVQKIERLDLCRAMLNFVLSLDAVVEHWVAKPSVNGYTFDLRVLWQFGRLEMIVPRGAHSPITNLHLNDMALDLPLVEAWVEEESLSRLCARAIAAIPGLTSAGLDVLCSPEGYQVIEINSQGDLIYRDIYDTNTIYRNQALHLLSLTGW